MANSFNNLRKRRTRQHVIADLSTNCVERHALLCGFSVERIRLDYGIDLIVHTYNHRGEIENGRVLLQLKATDRIRFSADGTFVSCRLDKVDLVYWLGESMPVNVILFDAKTESAYWCHIQLHSTALFGLEKTGQQVTMKIPSANLLTKQSFKVIARKKNQIVAQLRRGSHGAN